jgi:hypothetical protein
LIPGSIGSRQQHTGLADWRLPDIVGQYLNVVSNYLDEHFKNMTTFLRVPGVQRNSLAESGMRVLRRLEQNHDGFRTGKGRQNALKIYQAVTYLGWSIHNPPNLAASSG